MEDGINGNSTGSGAAAAAPNEIERVLLQIWSEVLNQENIGIHDDFLGLGGDSMAAMRCINRITKMFGVELPIDLFLLESVDVAQAASAITTMRLNSAEIAAPENA